MFRPDRFPALLLLPALPLLLLASALSSCLGGGSDQPNKAYGSVRGMDGKPVAGARVRLYSGAYHRVLDQDLEPSAAVLVDETGTDAEGRFDLPHPGPGSFYLEVRAKDSSAIAVVDSVGRQGRGLDAGKILLEKAAVIRGMASPADSIVSLHLAGTHLSARLDSSGAFAFHAVPPGPALVAARVAGNGEAADTTAFIRALHLNPGQVMDLDTVRLARDSLPPNPDTASRILLWDFETPDRRNLLRGILFPDTLPMGDLTGSWHPYLDFGVWPEAPYRGRFCMNMTLHAGEQGFFLAKGYVNLSRMREFVFYAKGTGTVAVRFRTGLAQTGMGTFQAQVALTPDWQRHVIRPEDIVAPPGSGLAQKGYTFQMAKDQVAGVFFGKVGPVAEFYLDDIELMGPSIPDL